MAEGALDVDGSETPGRPVAPILAAVWWFALSGLGLFFPFYSLYLREAAQLSGTAVGAVMAALPATGLLAQPLWGQIADRTGARTRVLAIVALGTALGYAGLALPSTLAGFLGGTIALAFFSTALIPTCVSVSLAALPEPSPRAFGRVRVMGTLGFGCSVGLLPFVLAATSASGAADDLGRLRLAFLLAGASVGIAAAVSLLLPTRGHVALRAARGDWLELMRNGPFLRVLAFTFATYFVTQGAMVLFPILVHSQGGGIEAISRMWLVMLALEVPLVFLFGGAVARLGPRGVIAIGTAASAVRWGVSGFAEDLDLVQIAQALHGVTVWGIILGVPYYVDRVVPERLRATAQGILAMVGISLGSILSNLAAGWLTETFGATTPARVAGVASGALLLLVPLLVGRLDVFAAREDDGGA